MLLASRETERQNTERISEIKNKKAEMDRIERHAASLEAEFEATKQEADFCVRWLKRRGLAQGCAFWGLQNLKLIFNVFIQKIPKNSNGAYGEN